MSLKFSYDNYTLTTLFKDDFSLSLTASDNFTGDYFINENVELTKIKKDTIIATLARKSENQLKCEFNLVDLEPKKLVIAIIVTYDFLPTFSEFIELQQIVSTKGVNKVETAELRSDIQGLEKLISSISSNSALHLTESTLSFSSKTEIYSRDLLQGSYLFEVSAYFTSTLNSVQKHELLFTFEAEKQKSEVVSYCAYMNSSYGYPFFLKKDINLACNSTLRVFAQHRQGSSSTLSNTIITVSPIVKLR